MNKRITKLFSCTLNNKVEVVDTNFESFYTQFKNLEKQSHSSRWFANKFKELDEFEYSIDNKKYYFQKLV